MRSTQKLVKIHNNFDQILKTEKSQNHGYTSTGLCLHNNQWAVVCWALINWTLLRPLWSILKDFVTNLMFDRLALSISRTVYFQASSCFCPIDCARIRSFCWLSRCSHLDLHAALCFKHQQTSDATLGSKNSASSSLSWDAFKLYRECFQCLESGLKSLLFL